MKKRKRLKLCAHCGNRKIDRHHEDVYSVSPEMATRFYRIECRDCGVNTGDFTTEAAAEKAWNRRV
jgi:ribosomal protein S27E